MLLSSGCAMSPALRTVLDASSTVRACTRGAPLLLLSLALQVCRADSLHDGPRASLPPDFFKLKAPYYSILVVAPLQLNAGPHCHSNPPRGMFRVMRVLKGHVAPERATMKWFVDGSEDESHVPWDSSMPPGLRDTAFLRPHTEAWKKTPMYAPQSGEPLLVFAIQEGPWRAPAYDVREIFEYSEENVQTALANMGAMDRSPMLQAPLLYAILLFPLAAVALLIGGQMSIPLRRGWWAAAGMLFGLVPLPLYLLYEGGMKTGGIRLDLIIAFPMIGLGVAATVMICVRKIWALRDRPRTSAIPPPIPRH